ncbi:hypothetical protein [Echinicola salinicaeni]|uniref:hypothetical protein n=1 Tax=Echinicola salinicaeni TaxID=2762757 RepID=UPI001647DC48|nr:hypothetical protein [Echinicola salinicaeni]
MTNYFYLLLFVLVLFSCKEDEGKSVYNSTLETKVFGKRLKSSDEILRVNIMYQYGELLYIVDPDKKHVFSIIDIAKDRVISRFGRVGEGPCELSGDFGNLRKAGRMNMVKEN